LCIGSYSAYHQHEGNKQSRKAFGKNEKRVKCPEHKKNFCLKNSLAAYQDILMGGFRKNLGEFVLAIHKSGL
jgi:hypothetical protein